jgi:hypothetical protein
VRTAVFQFDVQIGNDDTNRGAALQRGADGVSDGSGPLLAS